MTSGYLLCATPRTGSTLLCGLLESSGVAGHPASYFRREGVHDYAESWSVAVPRHGRIDTAYLAAARAAGSTANGVFGARLMGDSLLGLMADLAAGAEDVSGDRELLEAHLGRLDFVHLRRLDVVGQAVSWAKAQQTHFWHPGEEKLPGGTDPHYDEALIARLVASIHDLEAGWSAWFAEQGIVPYEVTYEELAADPVTTAQGVLDHLGLSLPAGRTLRVGHRRQANAVNADWVARFGNHPT